MPTTTPQLEEISIQDYSPTKIINDVLPSIQHRGVRISGFQGERHFDKDVRAILRLSQGIYQEIRDHKDTKNLIYTFIPLNGSGQSVSEMENQR